MTSDTKSSASLSASLSGKGPFVIPGEALDTLIKTLKRSGRQVIGPTVRDGAVMLDPIDGASDLPLGLVDSQEPGSYRLEAKKKAGYFDFTHGPETWKRHLFPPREKLWSAARNSRGKGFTITPEIEAPRQAFIGVRACELNAMAVQDKVFIDGDYQAGSYRDRRDKAFIVALNCRRAGGTCFCASMDTGPKVKGGYDLALTELKNKDRHDFLVEVGTEQGAKVLAKLPTRKAEAADLKAAKRATAKALKSMGRDLPSDVASTLIANPEHPRWNDIAERCLTCGNCTMVCPTCFCNSVSDTTALDGSTAERWRHWDSCFTMDFSYIHGGSVRREAAHRYRQWITHKLAYWHDQFGTSGCVGCGRCITWCPVGIDITAEVRAIASPQGATDEGRT
ncbi:4Fe-4S dicluster domain-containing protein [Pseudomonadota bacterium]